MNQHLIATQQNISNQVIYLWVPT